MENITIATIEGLIGGGIELECTHRRLCLRIINRIFKKMKAGIKFRDIRVSGNIICDGHHRYIASLLAELPIDKIAGTTTAATSFRKREARYECDSSKECLKNEQGL